MWKLCLTLAGCWTAPAPKPPEPEPVPPVSGTCTFRDRGVDPMMSVSLGVDGESFANLYYGLVRLEVTVANSVLARTQVETALVTLEGEQDLSEFWVRPRRPDVHDGWLEIHHSFVRGSTGSTARLEVPMPTGLVPRNVMIRVPCDDLTVEARPEHEPPPQDIVEVNKSTPLLRTIAGGTLARIVIDNDQGPIEVAVLERRRGMLRVRVSEPNAAIGWIAQSATTGRSYGAGYGGYGRGLHGQPSLLTCLTPVPIFVRSSTRGVVRVGTLKAERGIVIKKTGPDGIEIDLGSGDLAPFVRVSDVTACAH